MTPLLFILSIVLLFGMLFAYEASSDSEQTQLLPRQFGLFTWFISGNWPAKVGASLLILGIGALLRYALIHVDVPPGIKLGSGLVMAAILGAASLVLKRQPKRRAIHLALAGAAFGVAYLTAYSAYGFFGYINDIDALALLALVAVAAGVFAVSSNTMSVAILSMVGAYVAPKFAIGTPGIAAVYGYYLAASTLTLVMVAMRGWRPLIHLSFLFTLAGALFFGWAGKFYQPEYYAMMQPILLALTALHLAMSLLENRHAASASAWQARFDYGYFAALPIVAAGLTLHIAPSIFAEGALGLAGLALIWGCAFGILKMRQRSDAPRHAMVAALLMTGAILCRMHDVPLTLIALGLSVAALAAAPFAGWSRATEEVACGLAVLFMSLHVLSSIVEIAPTQAFMNDVFGKRLAACVMLGVGAWIANRRSIAFGKILGVTAAAWAVLSVGGELWRLNIDFVPQLAYGLLLGAIAIAAIMAHRMSLHPVLGGLLMVALTACGWWAVQDASATVVLVYFGITPVVLLGAATSSRDAARDGEDFYPAIALALLPFVLLPWASSTAAITGISTDFYEAAIATGAALVVMLIGRLLLADSPRWNDRIQPAHFFLVAALLLSVTLFHIERGFWPVAFELLALLYLSMATAIRMKSHAATATRGGVATLCAAVLVLQAMVLRVFGPEGVMDAGDINRLQLVALVSLMWAIFGGALAWWAVRIKSRSLWSAGAVLLVAAAIKLVLFDFGALGQLGNILALIAAGLVFMGVAWFAPMPPKAAPEPKSADQAAGAAVSAPRSGATRNVPVSEGVNGFWFVLLGLAMVIAVGCYAWHKQILREHALQRQKTVQYVPATTAASPLVSTPAPTVADPAATVPPPEHVAAPQAIALPPQQGNPASQQQSMQIVPAPVAVPSGSIPTPIAPQTIVRPVQ